MSRLTDEISNYTGVNDKTLAEFVLDLHGQSKDANDLKEKLSQVGAEFPDAFIENVDRVIRQLHPKYKNAKKTEDSNKSTRAKERIFKGLSLPDTEPIQSNAVDDALNQLKSIEQRGGRARSPAPRRHRGRKSESPPLPRDRRRRERSPSVDNFGRSRRRRDSFSDEEQSHNRWRREREPRERLDDSPIVGKIYEGYVTNVKNFGAFVTLEGVKGKVDGKLSTQFPRDTSNFYIGLVHVSAIREGSRVEHPEDVLQNNQPVKVKVMKIDNGKISLSMKVVDQNSGEDLDRDPEFATGANSTLVFRKGQEPPPSERIIKAKKRLTSPERWEIRQLIASGAISAVEYPELDDDINAARDNDLDTLEPEEEVDIEVREEEPPFLAGQTKQSLELSPVRVVRAPEGSLNRAAMSGASLARERREERQQQAKEKAQEERGKADISTQWHDPLAANDSASQNTKVFADDFRRRANQDVPEWKRANDNKNVTYGKRTNMSISDQRRSLPVYQLRSELLQAVRDNQIMIIVGDTGSGKTTQITQFLYEEGFARKGKIGCTQPRRVAAVSVAKRVAEEVGCKLGSTVGYTIRFEDCTSPQTHIKYMTDGMLQREALVDPNMSQYSVIMLDEAHERTIATDILFALLKKASTRRPDLKLIITSATLDAAKFSKYFLDCPILYIPGRTFPVDILYTKEPEFDYLDAALMTVMQIHLAEPPGDILVFLTGQEEIDTSCEVLYERMKALGPDVPELIVLPVYSALPSEMQSRIFDPAPPGSRKVVIATNIAETSITIDGIYYVVDPGFVKLNAYDPKLGMDSLVISPISQAQANQRSGRAGRTGPGKCYRLYTEQAFQTEMLANTIPEIQRQNLSHTILMLKAMGINDLLHFDFMDPPPANTLLTALEELYALSALDGEGLLTRQGRKMADFPMEPGLAKVLITSVEAKCSDEMLTIVAMLSVQNVFYRPKEKQQQADQKKAKFHDPNGDHLMLLNVYSGWTRSGQSRVWCVDNFIQERSLKRAFDVRQQLVSIMDRYKHAIISCGSGRGGGLLSSNTDIIRKALCAGFFRNSARKDPQEGYKTLIESTPVYMHPSSSLFGKPAEYVVYHTLLLTTKEYMHTVTTIDPKWLAEVAPTFFKVADPAHLSKRKKAERIQPLHDRYASDPNDWRLSAQKRVARGASSTFG